MPDTRILRWQSAPATEVLTRAYGLPRQSLELTADMTMAPAPVLQASPAEITIALVALQVRAPALWEESQRRTANNCRNGHGPSGKRSIPRRLPPSHDARRVCRGRRGRPRHPRGAPRDRYEDTS